MKKPIFYCLLLAPFFGVFTSCAPTLQLISVPEIPVIETTEDRRADENAVYELLEKKFTFPNTVQSANYYPQWRAIATNFKTEDRGPSYGILDLETEQLRWANRGNYDFSLLQKEVGLVEFEGKKVLIDAQTALPIRWVNQEEFVVIDDSITLKMDDNFSKVDLRTGQTHWTRRGGGRYDGWMTDELDGDWMYVIANDLHGFNLKSGQGWRYAAQTDYDASNGGRGFANILLFGLNVANAVYGTGFIDDFGYLPPKRAHNVNSKPKIDGSLLYFADRASIACLDKTTGRQQWKQRLPEEIGVSSIYKIKDQRLLLVSKGYRYVNYMMEKDEVPSLYYLDSEDGEIIRRQSLRKGEVIIDVALNDAFIYVVTNQKVYRFDHRLKTQKSIELPPSEGGLMRVIAWSSSRYDETLDSDYPEFPLVIRTEEGLLALHPVTLEKLWSRWLGRPLKEMPQMVTTDRWQRPIFLDEIDRRRSWVDEQLEVFWFAKDRTIVGVDLLRQGETVSEFVLESDAFSYVGNGTLFHFWDNHMALLQLNAQ
ncbi:MAG: PQQ-binding-like beta-propeller repeat protein [Bacteroidota bacterium]